MGTSGLLKPNKNNEGKDQSGTQPTPTPSFTVPTDLLVDVK